MTAVFQSTRSIVPVQLYNNSNAMLKQCFRSDTPLESFNLQGKYTNTTNLLHSTAGQQNTELCFAVLDVSHVVSKLCRPDNVQNLAHPVEEYSWKD